MLLLRGDNEQVKIKKENHNKSIGPTRPSVNRDFHEDFLFFSRWTPLSNPELESPLCSRTTYLCRLYSPDLPIASTLVSHKS